MIFCDQCGNEIKEGDYFCDSCGADVSSIVSSDKEGGSPRNDSIENDSGDVSSLSSSPVSGVAMLSARQLVFGIVAVAVVVMGVFSFDFLNRYQEQLSSAHQALTETREALDALKASTTESLSSLEETNQELKEENEEQEASLQAQQAQLSQQQSVDDQAEHTRALLREVMPLVVRIQCYQSSGITYGSGTIQPSASGMRIYTNAHVTGVSPSNTNNCRVFLPTGADFEPGDAIVAKRVRVAGQFPTIDFAVLNTDEGKRRVSSFPVPQCSVADVEIGDAVTVLGYPAIGGESLTVTDGIISGTVYTSYGPVYKTSAKIDHGNSGGIAIDGDSGCSIGIPTWATAGSFEGLGYIQSWDMIKESGSL